MSKIECSELPKNWRWFRPQEMAASEQHALGIGPFGSDLKVTDYRESGVPLVFVRNIRSGRYCDSSQPHITPGKAESLRAHAVRPGDILITKMGEPPGDADIYPDHHPDGIITADCIRLRIDSNQFSNRFIMLATRSPQVRSQIIGITQGVAQKKISLERFSSVNYSAPPLPEQHRIVAAIEEHFSRLDAAVAMLKRVQSNLKRARASVLKSAVEGRLVPTEATLARAEGRTYEPASELLKTILKERRRRWQESGKKGAYKEPVKPDTSELPELPEGWVWTCTDQLARDGRPICYGVLKAGEHVEDGIPLVRVTDIVAGDLGLERLKRCNPEREKLFARARLESGDLVITKDGTIGRCMLVPAWLDGANITQHVLRLSATREAVSAYLLHALHSPLLSSLMKKETRGVALQGINVEDFRLLPIPLPPLAEQHRIVAEVDRRLSVMDQLERTVEANLARCERLRQSILKRAFEGRLVSSDAPMPSAQPV